VNNAFLSDEPTIFAASCGPRAYIINKTVTKYFCSLYYNDQVRIRQVSPTGSMWPNLMGGGYAIVDPIKNEESIVVGDILIINETVFGVEVVHRVSEIGNDIDGLYFKTKGDNNAKEDNSKVRFEDVVGRVVGILY
jgi:signal peptidase I